MERRRLTSAEFSSAGGAVPVIAIDGPAGAGKGTVARLLAERLGFHYLDSGKIYRAAAWAALSAGRPPDDENTAAAMARQLAEDSNAEKLLQAEELSRPEVGEAASRLAKMAGARRALLPLQRRMRRVPGLVADGRDMGSVVFPDAILKVFLTCELRIRARRRLLQLQEKGMHATMRAVLGDLSRRDLRDRSRAQSPLAAAADAVAADSSRKSAAQTVAELAALYTARAEKVGAAKGR